MKIIRTNRAMRTALGQNGIPEISELSLEGANIFQDIISEGILTENGCLLLKKNISLCNGVKINDFPDLTGYECYINKINVDDYLPTVDPKELLQYSILLVRLLEEQLVKVDEKVKIVIGFQADDVITSSVRFHKVRSKESWLAADIEKYDECILVAEIN